MIHNDPFQPFPQKRRRAWPLILLCVIVIALAALVVAAGLTLRASLPQFDGTHDAPVSATVTIAREALGVPTVQGSTRDDVAYATGFVYAKDRFFQMDLLRLPLRLARCTDRIWNHHRQCIHASQGYFPGSAD